ncbi:uncharacterized protein L199_001073 [Kwoniella botswanensis]|uniref:uncharacterized protein n=1 Tax=Kwoniella botswanensis TaxID=1268659 RepID=UPI00315DFB8E
MRRGVSTALNFIQQSKKRLAAHRLGNLLKRNPPGALGWAGKRRVQHSRIFDLQQAWCARFGKLTDNLRENPLRQHASVLPGMTPITPQTSSNPEGWVLK